MQESHGDWLAAEHNSAVANNLKQKYGENNLDGVYDYFSHDTYDIGLNDNGCGKQPQAEIW